MRLEHWQFVFVVCVTLLAVSFVNVIADSTSNNESVSLNESNVTELTPVVNITDINSNSVSGVVENVTPELYNIVVYVKNGDLWWGPKPTFADPITTIKNDSTWDCQYNTDPNDATISTVAAYMVLKNVTPPQFKNGVSEISEKALKSVASDVVER